MKKKFNTTHVFITRKVIMHSSSGIEQNKLVESLMKIVGKAA